MLGLGAHPLDPTSASQISSLTMKYLLIGLLSIIVISLFQPVTDIPQSEPVQAAQIEVAQQQVEQQPATVTTEQLKPPPASSNEAKEYIYMHESSNDPSKVNSRGCYGLGQDCNNVLSTACPNWRTDRECQDKFWEDYMRKRYGTWENAKAFWIAQCPSEYGCWW